MLKGKEGITDEMQDRKDRRDLPVAQQRLPEAKRGNRSFRSCVTKTAKLCPLALSCSSALSAVFKTL